MTWSFHFLWSSLVINTELFTAWSGSSRNLCPVKDGHTIALNLGNNAPWTVSHSNIYANLILQEAKQYLFCRGCKDSYLIHTSNYLELSSISRIWNVNQAHILKKSPSTVEGDPAVFGFLSDENRCNSKQ